MISAKRQRLPRFLRTLFWQYDFSKLRWDRDHDLVIGQILTAGGWDAILWLRKRLGHNALRDWIIARQGKGLSPRQLRYWELILGLPHRQVTAWLAAPGRAVWDGRAGG